MSDQQLRDKIARALHQHATDDGEVHILWGGVEEHEEEVAEWIPFADAVLAVIDLDKIRAEAWDEGAKAAREENFMDEDFEETPNPYRKGQRSNTGQTT